jgi:hypothetical protein
MPARSRSADDPPERTTSFVCEVSLWVSPAQERTLLARLEAARQVGVTCLGQARTRVWLVHESKAGAISGRSPTTIPYARRAFARLATSTVYPSCALHGYARQFGHSWLEEHLDSLAMGDACQPGLSRRQLAALLEGAPGVRHVASTSRVPPKARRRSAASAGAGTTSNGRG